MEHVENFTKLPKTEHNQYNIIICHEMFLDKHTLEMAPALRRLITMFSYHYSDSARSYALFHCYLNFWMSA